VGNSTFKTDAKLTMRLFNAKTISCFRLFHNCFWYEGETREEFNLVIFTDKPTCINNCINERFDRARDLNGYE